MEAAGLGVGVIGLVSLFGTCLDMLERWDSYKDFGLESGSLRARFIADQVRFKQWGQRVGIGQTSLDGHPALNDISVRSAVDIILHSIRNIDDNSKRSAPYLRNFFDFTNFHTGVPNGQKHINQLQSISSRRDKLSWTFRGKARALNIVRSFEVLVQKLYDLVPLDSINLEGQIAAEEGQGKSTTPIKSTSNWRHNAHKILLHWERQIHDESQREVHAWLDAPDMKRTYDDFNLRRLTGTCDWVFGRSEFHQWQSFAPGNKKILWINGNPGYGKTILCARLVNHMLANSQIYVGYFFLSSEVKSRANPFIVMRSWIAQLLTQTQQAMDMTRDKWEATDAYTASETEIKELFNSLVQILSPCIFVVDGLDECTADEISHINPKHERSLLGFLKFVTDTISKSISRLLIVSRDDWRIREGLSLHVDDVAELQISPTDVEADAYAFSRSIISRKLSNKSDAHQKALAKILVDRCESMFLAIRLLEDDLKGGKNLKQLQQAINKAPNQLDHIYDRDWERIQHLENNSRRRAFSILRWAAFALRPLTVLEITECLLISDGENDRIDYEELPDSVDGIYVTTEILELCGSLIEIREEPDSALDGSTVHLTHFSAKQYILTHIPIETSEVVANEQFRSSNEAFQNNILAKQCLRYLNCDQTWKGSSVVNGNIMIHAFREYAAGLWQQHVKRNVSNSEEVLRLINSFFRPPNPNWESWRKKYEIDNNWVSKGDRAKEVGDPLLYASLFELTETVHYLINEVGLEVDHGYFSSRSRSGATNGVRMDIFAHCILSWS
ncbi:prion-inhibition and propagation-domain-containing protein [Xylaria scruposa]|nr:prion-inhibition and propagation-domain-containing protein [Xylaria scruposa]